jgi:hypothetical protein
MTPCRQRHAINAATKKNDNVHHEGHEDHEV